jgi:hypothetical protein
MSTVWELREKEKFAIGIRYQRTNEETADREDSAYAVVNCVN